MLAASAKPTSADNKNVLMIITENTPYDELIQAFLEVKAYGRKTLNQPKIKKAVALGRVIIHRVKTAQNKIPAIYVTPSLPGRDFYQSCLSVACKDGEGLGFTAINPELERVIFLLHAHAIDRFFERHGYKGTRDDFIKEFLLRWSLYNQADYTETSAYIYFNGGVFITERKGGITHLRTFVMNRQLYADQRLLSLKSEQITRQTDREFENKLKQLLYAN